MQNRRLPSHPSLPPIPQPSFPQYLPSYSSHYVQAYSQAYNPHNPAATSSFVSNSGLQPSHPSPAWYQPGNCTCTYKGCSFAGSHKALETHMMDRHLIYPPGWEKRSKKPDWDADPSLKGKPILIQGTNLNLDKPEDLEAWLAERKRRWPTAPRVEEKKRKIEEAIARGQLSDNLGFNGNKRRRTDEGDDARYGDRSRGRGRGRGNSSRGRARATDSGWQGRGGPAAVSTEDAHTVPSSSIAQVPAANATDSEDDDECSPEVISSKVPVVHVSPGTDLKPVLRTTNTSEQKRTSTTNRHPKRPPPQPKKEPHNPFASRPTLLRNVQMPPIHAQIEN
ncbi:hypothetical protein D9615_005326 [Tricholomella constricta]|uniref:FMR1-interacting protein 1 conserved domain-containing protein n=1 Tax=Tricholomella constricta TaxID=117010 RepID=A0A8H5H5N8_9AGAR|nr:hypothetical protein D9615_005326 [Tricholomella constricta]